MKYEVVIGLETHVELATESKIFCSCGGHTARKTPNDCVCPACCGMPGMLPVMNKRVVELAIMAGTLLNCKINRYITFDKKNYFYPDLPCSYQITQWFHPICVEGSVELETRSGKRTIGIKQIHMEEDAGKLVHDDWTDTTMIDFNRTSVPLIEIVSKPDFRSVEEVLTYLEKLKSMFRFAKISECEDGAMRCDVNISLRPEGSEKLGVRTEIKNMSSLASIERAIKYEIARHTDALERQTEVLVQETRRWDDTKGRTFAMRNKETAEDYRYFPDPNLMPIIIDDDWIQRVRSTMSVTPDEKKAEYRDLGLSEKEIETLTAERNLCDILDDLIASGIAPKTAATWILTECGGLLRKKGLQAGDLDIDTDKLIRIIELVETNAINRAAGKRVLAAVLDSDVDPDAYCAEHQLDSQGDRDVLLAVVLRVMEANQKAVNDYLSGKEKAAQALFGNCMRELRGTGDPAAIKALLEEELQKRKG